MSLCLLKTLFLLKLLKWVVKYEKVMLPKVLKSLSKYTDNFELIYVSS
jgi:hypothetical protein